MNDEELSSLIQRHAQRHAASARLRAAVQTQVTLHALAQRRVPGFAQRLKQWLPRWASPSPAGHARGIQLGLGFAAGVLLTLALVWGLPRMPLTGGAPGELSAELLSLHVRSMGTGGLFQVASSDRHTVKPWFQGKLDYAPEVPDLSDAGYVLLGGRIDRLQGHDTAALAYQWRKHMISAYVLPDAQVLPTQQLQQRGFHIAHWSDGVMQVWAVTDADASELERFASAWHTRVAPPAGAAP